MVNDVFTNAVELLDEAGVLDVILPFLIVFTLVYAISKSVPHLREDNRIRGVISVVIGLMVIIPHATQSYPAGMDVVDIINQSIPQVALFLVAIVLAFLLVAATSFKDENNNLFKAKWVKWFALIIVGLIFLDNIGTRTLSAWPFMEWFGNEDFQALILVVLIFGLIVWFITRDSSGESKKKYHCSKCGQDSFGGKSRDEVLKHIDDKHSDDNEPPKIEEDT